MVRELDKADLIKADSIFMETVNKAIAKAEGEAWVFELWLSKDDRQDSQGRDL